REITPDFLPRLGFAPQVGFKAARFFAVYNRQFVGGGPLANVNMSASFQRADKYDGGGVYLNSDSLNFGGTTRSEIGFEFGYRANNFEGAKDRLYTVGLTYPATPSRGRGGRGGGNLFRQASVTFTFGDIEGDAYRELRLRGRYRLPSTLTLGASLQFVETGGDGEVQHILSVSYDLSEFQSIAGRAVIRDEELNWFLSFRQSGGFGAEYFLIIGDPNSERFESRIVLKAVIPVDIRP
ncbi:MAG: hypothetical protein IH851_07390, partial [Armatimonadetes bacterium]|nr:hypothetical protein [Armatimonadota bacterium]